MASAVPGVVAEIDAITTLDDLDHLHQLIGRFFALADAAQHLDVWFRLYERFPIDTGQDRGVFWSILHSLEAQPDCERLVVASVRRMPADFPVRMVNRLLNAGCTTVGGVDLLALLQSVAADETCLPEVRRSARKLSEYQQQRRTK